MLLSKGFEVELYTGTPQGTAVGFSADVAASIPGFVREPDQRNVEYTTAPITRYEDLLCALLRPRQALRQFLQHKGDYTLLPGSTLALGGTEHFDRSDPGNPYHDYIETTYGTSVVTASIHINVGIQDPELLMQACRLIRLEAPLYLALSASSPFLGGAVTGKHSSRWAVFPQTPDFVPLFTSHAHYIAWTQAQLEAGTMQNVRHLWSSVRPNGSDRPYHLNRLELRIVDMVSDPIHLLAIAALLEARLWQMLQQPERFDPLLGAAFSPTELVEISRQNELAVAEQSLAAPLIHWQTGQTLTAAEWIEQQYTEAWLTSHARGFSCFLSPLQTILAEGNEAQRWQQQVAQGQTVAAVYQGAIAQMAEREQALVEAVCLPSGI